MAVCEIRCQHPYAPVRNKSDPTPALSHLILLSTPELLKEYTPPLPVYVRHWKYHSSPEMNLSAYISSVIKAESVRSCCGQSRHVMYDAAHPPDAPLCVLRFHRLVLRFHLQHQGFPYLCLLFLLIRPSHLHTSNRSQHRLASVSPVSSEKVCRFHPLHTAAYLLIQLLQACMASGLRSQQRAFQPFLPVNRSL